MKHASSMVKYVHRNKYHTVVPVIVLKVKKMKKIKCFEIYLSVIFVIKYEISYLAPTFLCQ